MMDEQCCCIERRDLTCKMYAKEQRFYCYSAFHSHNRVFNNEHSSYPKMGVFLIATSLNEWVCYCLPVEYLYDSYLCIGNYRDL